MPNKDNQYKSHCNKKIKNLPSQKLFRRKNKISGQPLNNRTENVIRIGSTAENFFFNLRLRKGIRKGSRKSSIHRKLPIKKKVSISDLPTCRYLCQD